MGPHGFAIVVNNTGKTAGGVIENTIYRYSNSLELLWEAVLVKDGGFKYSVRDFGSENFYASPDGKTIYRVSVSGTAVEVLNENGEGSRGKTTIPAKAIEFFTFADNDHLNIGYKLSKHFKKHSSKEKEPLYWVTIDGDNKEDVKEIFLPIPEFTSYGKDYWDVTGFIDGTAYLSMDCSPKKEASYTEFLSVNVAGKINVAKLFDPEPIIAKAMTSLNGLTDKQIRVNSFSKQIYLRYIIEDGAKFQINCFDMELEEAWSTIHDYSTPLKMKGTINKRYNYMKSLNNGTYAYQLVQPLGGGGAQTFFFSEETGEIVSEISIEYKVKPTEKAGNLINLNNSLIYFYPNGEAKNMLAEKSESFEKRKDLKVSKYIYMTTEMGEIVVFMLNKKEAMSSSLTGVEMYYYEH